MKSHCPGCGVLLDVIDGPVHKYLESSPACWAQYGAVLAREYSDPAFMNSHHFTVDAYALQHPGHPRPQTIQSAAIHLLSLYVVLERGGDHDDAVAVMQAATERRWILRWLDPPGSRYPVRVTDLVKARTAEEHARVAEAWARSTWAAWASHHEQARDWYEALRPFTRKA